jgi:hypothetical protein
MISEACVNGPMANVAGNVAAHHGQCGPNKFV